MYLSIIAVYFFILFYLLVVLHTEVLQRLSIVYFTSRGVLSWQGARRKWDLVAWGFFSGTRL